MDEVKYDLVKPTPFEYNKLEEIIRIKPLWWRVVLGLSIPGYAWYGLFSWIKSFYSSSHKTLELQKEMAIALIKEGADRGVKRMRVKIDKSIGVNIGSDIEGIPVKLNIGTDGTMEIEVEYK
jgi:hypothetical protein